MEQLLRRMRVEIPPALQRKMCSCQVYVTRDVYPKVQQSLLTDSEAKSALDLTLADLIRLKFIKSPQLASLKTEAPLSCPELSSSFP